MLLLDTDVISHLFRRTAAPEMMAALARHPMVERVTSAIAVGEIIYGFEKSGAGDARRELMEHHFLRRLQVLPFDEAAARMYGKVRADLERRNQSLHGSDLRIAAIALSRDLILATGNRKHYERVQGLRLLEW